MSEEIIGTCFICNHESSKVKLMEFRDDSVGETGLMTLCPKCAATMNAKEVDLSDESTLLATVPRI